MHRNRLETILYRNSESILQATYGTSIEDGEMGQFEFYSLPEKAVKLTVKSESDDTLFPVEFVGFGKYELDEDAYTTSIYRLNPREIGKNKEESYSTKLKVRYANFRVSFNDTKRTVKITPTLYSERKVEEVRKAEMLVDELVEKGYKLNTFALDITKYLNTINTYKFDRVSLLSEDVERICYEGLFDNAEEIKVKLKKSGHLDIFVSLLPEIISKGKLKSVILNNNTIFKEPNHLIDLLLKIANYGVDVTFKSTFSSLCLQNGGELTINFMDPRSRDDTTVKILPTLADKVNEINFVYKASYETRSKFHSSNDNFFDNSEVILSKLKSITKEVTVRGKIFVLTFTEKSRAKSARF